ncbi:MAG: hypothetical protein GYB31_05075 [Bacteroidetes bacterium]|nr:hypothetical protein [Bacteroidota bacterium]
MNIFHALCGVISLLAGLGIFLSRKGTRLHRRMGWTYTISMFVLLITSFFIYDFFGRFGAFHILFLLSAGTLMIGLSMPLFFRNRWQNWVIHHYFWMSYSYVGLVMATGSHLFGLVPAWPVWLRICAFWLFPYLVGTILIYSWKNRVLASLPGKD